MIVKIKKESGNWAYHGNVTDVSGVTPVFVTPEGVTYAEGRNAGFAVEFADGAKVKQHLEARSGRVRGLMVIAERILGGEREVHYLIYPQEAYLTTDGGDTIDKLTRF